MANSGSQDIDMLDVSPSQDVAVKRRKIKHSSQLEKQHSSTFEQELNDMVIDGKQDLCFSLYLLS